MPVRSVELEDDVCERLAPDAYVLFVASDERPLQGLAGLVDWRLAGGLSRLVLSGAVTGESEEKVLASPDGETRALVFGLGDADRMASERFEAIARAASEAIDRARWDLVAVGLPEQPATAREALRKHLYACKADAVIVGAREDASRFEEASRPAPATRPADSVPPPGRSSRKSKLSRRS